MSEEPKNDAFCCDCDKSIDHCTCQRDDELFWDEDGGDYFPCMCQYCPCSMGVMGGGICNDCLAGAHQG